MPSGWVRTGLKSTLYIAIVAVIVGLYAWVSPEAFARIPEQRDESIAGDWYVDRYGSFRKYSFRMDGTGEILSAAREPRVFRWGVENGQLRMKFQTSAGWQAPTYRIERFPEGPLELQDSKTGYRILLKRDVPKSATLQ